jgi:hypothetical protein
MPVRALFTDRSGGRSAGEYAANNLASHVGDDPDVVRTNRRRAAELVGARRLVVLQAIRGGPIGTVTAASSQADDAEAGTEAGSTEVDGVEGLVCADPGVALAVLVADCVPVLLADEHAGVVAVAHSGRRGTAVDITGQAVVAMQGAGARPERLRAWVGPAICGRCYEVGEQVQREVALRYPVAATRTPHGTAALDLPSVVLEQLAAAGVRHVEHDDRCTAEDPTLYSYRRDGRTGRQAGIVVWDRP